MNSLESFESFEFNPNYKTIYTNSEALNYRIDEISTESQSLSNTNNQIESSNKDAVESLKQHKPNYSYKLKKNPTAPDISAIIETVNHKSKIYEKQLPKDFKYAIQEVVLFESIIEVELNSYFSK
ncbi:hypothetical protein [Flavobacteriaceae bacterium 14752]|uniref:hypothetical protein n=1 Tax=Mesohalobacter salilacus TaxID=2491711 RepID=UPI000F6305B8|nr:hypothetical protein EIG84_01960 [Flavobacteriaceae bacterium 14752]